MSEGEFLGLKAPGDMLAKAERELRRLESTPSVDHAFNFLVTVYHVRDYALAAGVDVTRIDADPEFGPCRLAANSGKHLELARSRRDAESRGFETHADVVLVGTDREYTIRACGREWPVLTLGRRVLGLWREVLAQGPR